MAVNREATIKVGECGAVDEVGVVSWLTRRMLGQRSVRVVRLWTMLGLASMSGPRLTTATTGAQPRRGSDNEGNSYG